MLHRGSTCKGEFVGQRILLADDSNVAQRMGKEILSAEGFDVTTVSNGQAALKKLRDFNPDLIIADIFMPGIGGYELCATVKADPQSSHVPVVLLVGAMEPYDPDEGRKAKADAVITKPLQSSSLLSTVKKLLAFAKTVPPPIAAPGKSTSDKPHAAPPPLPIEIAPAPPASAPEEPPALAPAAATEQAEAVIEQHAAVSFEQAETVLEVPPDMAGEPVAALEHLLDTAGEPQEASADTQFVTDAPADTYAEPFALQAESVTDEAGVGETASDAFPAFPFPSMPETEESADAPFPIAFPGEDMQPAETATAGLELTADGTLSGESVSTDTAAEPELSALGFVSGSSTALEQTSADAGVLSVISEVSQAEPVPVIIEQPAEPEAVAPDMAPGKPIAWTVESADVTAADRSRFGEPAPDWGALTQLAEAVEPDAPVVAVTLAEPEAAAPPVEIPAPALQEEQQESSELAAEPQQIAAELAIDPAHVEKLVRESLDLMMPQIVDRIVRSVEIVLRREQD